MANPVATFKTSVGQFTAEIYLDRVPITASNFIDLCNTGLNPYRFPHQKTLTSLPLRLLQWCPLPPSYSRIHEPIRLPARQGPQKQARRPFTHGTFVTLCPDALVLVALLMALS